MSSGKVFICGLCERVFKKMSVLQAHNRKDHPKIDHKGTTVGEYMRFSEEYKGRTIHDHQRSTVPSPV